MDSFMLIAALLIPAYLIQSFLGFKQMKTFGEEYSKMRRKGRVAIGRRSGKLASGTIVLLSLDEEGYICEGRKLQGTTVAARFKDFNTLNGRRIDTLNFKDQELAKETKNTKKAVVDAVNNYNLVINGKEIPEKKAPLSALADNVKGLFMKTKEEAQ
ncbi:transcriptional regulator GutM [Alkalibacterium sp. MB6]|uniref:transcriptional regulator GutM n=1 Tax=Alkalibacterium sp. MB6 TaxID=2081965 RepID=UPI00137A4701|nr:transcriptional regulator GutM [Alkalibacterium sp. MB6]